LQRVHLATGNVARRATAATLARIFYGTTLPRFGFSFKLGSLPWGVAFADGFEII
jgi:hypothetical protein